MFGLINDLPYLLLVILPVGLMAITVHEVAHGFVAWRLGDPTAHAQGRLTLNPIAHLDPVGTLMILFVGFGWAKPVPVNPGYFRNPTRGMMFVALAGPISNIVMAIAAALFLRGVLLLPPDYLVPLGRFFQFAFTVNVVLAAFNMIPIPPLDGSRVVNFFLPPRIQRRYAEIEPYGIFILIVVIFLLPYLGAPNIIRMITYWALNLFYAIMA